MMHGYEKSDPAIVARKPANKAAPAVPESAERRAGAKRNARQQSTLRTQIRAGVIQALDRVRQAQGYGKGNGSPRFSTMSTSIHSRPHSTRSSARRPLGSME
jgi:hypothetical protein